MPTDVATRSKSTAPLETSKKETTEPQSTINTNANAVGDSEEELQKKTAGRVDELAGDLGQVHSLDGLCTAVGAFLTASAPGLDNTANGEIEISLLLKGIVEIKLVVDLDVNRDVKKLTVAGGVRLTVSRVFDVFGLADVKVGAYVGGEMEAVGDNGTEVMRLAMLAILPGVSGVSERLAEAIYESPAAYKAMVLKGMGKAGTADEDSIKTSLAYGAALGVSQGDEEAGSMEVGRRTQTTLTKGEDGELHEEEKEGMTMKMAAKVKDVGWGFEYDGSDPSASIKGNTKFKIQDKTLAMLVAGTVQGAAGMAKLVHAAATKADMDTKELAAISIARNKLLAAKFATLAAYKQKGVEATLAVKVSIVPKFKLTISVLKVAKFKRESKLFGSKMGLNVTLKAGQKLLTIGG